MPDVPFRCARPLATAIRRKRIGCLELPDLYLARVPAPSDAETSGRPCRLRPGRAMVPSMVSVFRHSANILPA